MHCSFVRVIPGLFLRLTLLAPGLLLAASDHGQITRDQQRIAIHYQASLQQAERSMIHRWLNQVTDALMTVYGELPRDDFRITIERSSSTNSPVPWGQVERTTPTNVLLVVNPELGYDELISDWTAFHELSHLLLPYRGYGNIWLSEGLATYYQNIIQARAGLLDEHQMWQKIAAGFDRGSKEQRWRHYNLTDVSDNMRETRQYMRIHWSGVLFWLTADVKLRESGAGTLDAVLKQLRDCCEHESMSAEAIVHKLDELTEEQIFVPLFEQFCESYSIPDYSEILAELGIQQEKRSRAIALNNTAPLAVVRQQIYRKEP